jgi:hypothetical protein
MTPLHVENHGNGVFLARYPDGSTYGVNVNVDDTAPNHVALAEAIKAGTVNIVPRPPADMNSVKGYFIDRIDRIATLKLQTAQGAAAAAQTAKLDEARDVLDMLMANPDDLSALTPDDLIQRYPTLAASGPDLAATARLVMSKAAEQRQALHDLEKWRLDAKAAIRAASDETSVRVAFDSATATG